MCIEGAYLHKKKIKTVFSTQEEIDWGALPSRLCNEMRREERGPKSRPAEEDGTKWRMKRRGEGGSK